ncbi:MAG: hypothetical protein GX801_08165 [Fibrobacter sp.]|nr:hypothetical protein [Fibrobacter sp.]
MRKSFLFTILFVFCGSLWAQTQLFYNQMGYKPEQQKIILANKARFDSIYVYNSKGSLQGVFPLAPKAFWDAARDSVRAIDLSAIKDTGTYRLTFPMSSQSYHLRISNNPLQTVTDAALKFFYYQRAGEALPEKYAGKWHRPAGHPDTLVYMHPSSGEKGTMSSAKGWYDAGDYGKYIVNSGITTYTLLTLWEEQSEKFKKRRWNIPESTLPDLLAETRYNLDWMLTMQSKDGGVYHKMTALNFCGSIMPHEDTDKRYVIGKSTTAAMNFAAVMAYASRVYAPFDAKYSQTMLAAAKKAYDWGLENPRIIYHQPGDVQTGQYSDQDPKDEIFWASAEMLLATQDTKGPYMKQLQLLQAPIRIPSWQMVNALGYYTMARHPKIFGSLGARAQELIVAKADELVKVSQQNPYGISLDNGDFVWGSNSVVANFAIAMVQAHRIKPKAEYLQYAHRHLDYLLGQNPLGLSYVTGMGFRSVLNPHHRPSEADGIDAPVPGMLAGGPHDGGHDISEPHNPVPWQCKEYRVIGFPAMSFIDHRCSYATNEVAINWNAPLGYLSASLE